MRVIDNEMIVCFDVDDTIVKWSGNHTQPHTHAIEFTDPYNNDLVFLIPHKKHINLLKQLKNRGYTIIVWSGGGYRWAETVVNTLKLESYVDTAMSKPAKYVDDLQAHDILGSRIFLEDD
jgi:hydroxymethylpyrimidine pyrophosphatase-like HAD family hydrolase